MTDKEILRQEARRARDLIVPGGDDAEKACDLFFEAVQPWEGQVVALYWPRGREFDTSALAARLLAEGISCCLPVVQEGSRVLRFAGWDENVTLAPGPFGVMQPVMDGSTRWVTPDIVVVPLLAFDQRGNRLGYGGGYYDATLQDLRSRKSVLAVGWAYAQQAVLFNLPAEAHDQRLDYVVTQYEAFKFDR